MHSSSLIVPPPSLSQIINSTRLNSRVGSRPCSRFEQEHLFQIETWATGRTSARSHCCSVGLQYPAALRWTARADTRRCGTDACGRVGRDDLPCDPFDSGCTAAQSSPNLSTRLRPHPPPRLCPRFPTDHTRWFSAVCAPASAERKHQTRARRGGLGKGATHSSAPQASLLK